MLTVRQPHMDAFGRETLKVSSSTPVLNPYLLCIELKFPIFYTSEKKGSLPPAGISMTMCRSGQLLIFH